MICPYCTSEETERDGGTWFCRCCAKAWKAFTENDRGFLKKIRVAAE